MSSINPQIEAAVPLQKERAATFDDRKQPLDEWVEQVGEDAALHSLLSRAHSNLENARCDHRTIPMRYLVRQDLLDCMNLCALALSLVPDVDVSAGDAPF